MDKAAKKVDGLLLSYAVSKVQWASNPTGPTATRLWKSFTCTLIVLKITKFKVLYLEYYILLKKAQIMRNTYITTVLALNISITTSKVSRWHLL